MIRRAFWLNFLGLQPSMDITEQLRVLRAAQGDPAKLALTTVDLAYPMLTEAERITLKASLEAAAIPHWCDETILAALLEIPLAESIAQLDRLRSIVACRGLTLRGKFGSPAKFTLGIMYRRAKA